MYGSCGRCQRSGVGSPGRIESSYPGWGPAIILGVYPTSSASIMDARLIGHSLF